MAEVSPVMGCGRFQVSIAHHKRSRSRPHVRIGVDAKRDSCPRLELWQERHYYSTQFMNVRIATCSGGRCLLHASDWSNRSAQWGGLSICKGACSKIGCVAWPHCRKSLKQTSQQLFGCLDSNSAPPSQERQWCVKKGTNFPSTNLHDRSDRLQSVEGGREWLCCRYPSCPKPAGCIFRHLHNLNQINLHFDCRLAMCGVVCYAPLAPYCPFHSGCDFLRLISSQLQREGMVFKAEWFT